MKSAAPRCVVLGGPNGAGKTTVSSNVLQESMTIPEFVNADVIARGLSGFDPDRAAIAAGRIMLTRLKELRAERKDFAFESTLASRTFAPFLRALRDESYYVGLVYVWLDSPQRAIRRVSKRVTRGGHDVPPDVIRRRYYRSIANLVSMYIPVASEWVILNNSAPSGVVEVARGVTDSRPTILRPKDWNRIMELSDEGDHQQRSE